MYQSAAECCADSSKSQRESVGACSFGALRLTVGERIDDVETRRTPRGWQTGDECQENRYGAAETEDAPRQARLTDYALQRWENSGRDGKPDKRAREAQHERLAKYQHHHLSLIHISEPTRLGMISYA